MLEAERIIRQQEMDLLESFGLPLYVTDPGRRSPMPWPRDPEEMTPEEMQELIETYGEEAVTQWVMATVAEKALAESDELEF